jgi:CHAT domain-containing protein/tetratricopeptide (TPR) repeat protein
MNNSHAITDVVSCPNCGEPFEAATWVIVDVGERPDLVDQIVDEKIHCLNCPHCTHELSMRAPLLIYDAAMPDRFAFSPPDGMPASQAREIRFRLVSLFRKRAGNAWCDEWLGRETPIVLRENLRFNLMPPSARQRWREAIRATAQAEHATKTGDVDKALQAWDDLRQDPAFDRLPQVFRCEAMGNRGVALIHRYRMNGDLTDLNQAISHMDAAREQMPQGHRQLAGLLSNLTRCLLSRFKATGAVGDIERAIGYCRDALHIVPPTSAARWALCGTLTDALLEKYKRIGATEDVEEAIRHNEDSLKLAPGNDASRMSVLAALGNALQLRYFRSGNLSDLDREIGCYQEASRLVAPDDDEHCRILARLAGAFNLRYESTRVAADLEQVIAVAGRALEKDPDDAVRGSLFNCLASALHNRSLRDRKPGDAAQIADLNQAIELYGRYLALGESRDTDRAGVLSNLGYTLRDRYDRTGNTADLDGAIAACREAVDSVPPGSPPRAMFLNQLATALQQRHGLNRSMPDLEEAVAAYREACQSGLATAVVEGTLKGSDSWGGWAITREAWQEAGEAYGYGLSAIDLLVRTQLSRTHKETWLEHARRMPDLAAYACARAGDLARSVTALEEGRARLLSEAMERERHDLERLTELGHAGLLERYRTAVDRLVHLSGPTGDAREDPPNRDRAAELRDVRVEIDAAIHLIRGVPGYSDFFCRPTFADIAAATRPGMPLVYLMCTSVGSLALICSRSGDQSPVRVVDEWVRSFTLADLLDLLSGASEVPKPGSWLGVYEAWKQKPNDPIPWQQCITRVTGRLGAELMGQVVLRLQAEGAKEAVLIPVGLLGLLPLHAAWVERDGATSYLQDVVSFTYAPSARAISHCRERASPVDSQAAQLLAICEPTPVSAAGPLHFAAMEVHAVSAFFGTDVLVLRNAHAAKSDVLAALPRCQVSHFCCHGLTDWRDPLSSGMLLANDEMLTVRDLSALRSGRARLAVLSACETGIVGTRLPDEVVALPAAFLGAGFAGVVSSLWSVGDLSTSLLMERFYLLWRQQRLPPALALAGAQRWLRTCTAAELAERFRVERQKWAASGGIRCEQASVAWRWFAEMPRQATPFSHPLHWAAFYFTGQ